MPSEPTAPLTSPFPTRAALRAGGKPPKRGVSFMTRSASSSLPASQEPVTVDIDDTHKPSTEELDVVVREELDDPDTEAAEDPAEPITPALPDFDEVVFGEPTTSYDEAPESLADSPDITVGSEELESSANNDTQVGGEYEESDTDAADGLIEPTASALPDFDEMAFGEPTTAIEKASESPIDNLDATVDSEVAGVNAGKWATSASLAAPHLPTFDEILSGEVKIVEDIEDEDVSSLDDGNDMSTDVVPFDLNLYRSANGESMRLQRRLTVLTVLVAILTVVVVVLAGLMAWWWFSPSTFLNLAGSAEVVFQNSYA